MASINALSTLFCFGLERLLGKKSCSSPIDVRNHFQLAIDLLCFSVVLDVVAAAWAIFAAQRRAKSLSHWAC
jgi:hypothetical protein